MTDSVQSGASLVGQIPILSTQPAQLKATNMQLSFPMNRIALYVRIVTDNVNLCCPWFPGTGALQGEDFL